MSDECWAYCWPQSATPGGRVELRASASVPAVDVTVIRVHGPDRGTDVVVHEVAAVPVGDHGFDEDAYSSGCPWPALVDQIGRAHV